MLIECTDMCLLGQRDARDIAAIEALCFDTAWDEAMYQRVLPHERLSTDSLIRSVEQQTLPVDLLVFGLCADEELVGYISIRPIFTIRFAEIYNVAVTPRWQGQGRGHRLLKQAIGVLERLGVEEMNLEVRAGNAAAIALYTKNGFMPCGLRKSYYPDGEDALLMERLNL